LLILKFPETKGVKWPKNLLFYVSFSQKRNLRVPVGNRQTKWRYYGIFQFDFVWKCRGCSLAHKLSRNIPTDSGVLCNKAVIHFCRLFLIFDLSGIGYIHALILVLIDLITFYIYWVSVRRLGSKHVRLHSNKVMKGYVYNIYFNQYPLYEVVFILWFVWLFYFRINPSLLGLTQNMIFFSLCKISVLF
jgi:hypothetical protein